MIQKYNKFLGIIFVIFFVSCSSIPRQNLPGTSPKDRQLTPRDWQLHDQLLQAYVDIQSISADNVVAVPAYSQHAIVCGHAHVWV